MLGGNTLIFRCYFLSEALDPSLAGSSDMVLEVQLNFRQIIHLNHQSIHERHDEPPAL